MKTKLRAMQVFLTVLLAFAMLGLSACGCSATQGSSSSESSSSAAESSSSAASDQEAAEGSQAADSGTSASGGSSSGQQGASASQTDASEIQVEHSTISVSVSIQSSNAGDLSIGSISKTVTLEPGATAYDALVATGVSVGGSSSYVTSINGLAEKSCGPTSGWTYYVNGGFLSKPANRAKLGNGDSVTWVFVTSPDDRL